MSENPKGTPETVSSGRGHRCIGISALKAFNEDLEGHRAWIDIVETFEIADGLEIPRLDLSIYGDHGAYELPASERRRLAADRLSGLLAAVAKESAEFGFTVWLDQED